MANQINTSKVLKLPQATTQITMLGRHSSCL